MKKPEAGFTMLELVMVIVIVGILAAAATVRYADLRGDANKAVLKGLAAQLNAAMEHNKNVRLINATNAVTIGNCSQAGVLLNGGLPTGFTLAALPLTTPFETGVCTVSMVLPDTQSATFIGYGISS